MIQACVALLFSHQISVPAWVPHELRQEAQYSFVASSPIATGGAWVLYRRVRDDSTLTIQAFPTSSPEQRYPMSAGGNRFFETPLDGYPLGWTCEIWNKTSELDIRAKASKEDLHVFLTSPRVSSDHYAKFREDDFTNDEPTCVRLVRIAMAGFAARRAGTVTKIGVHGAQVDSFVASETDAQFVDLTQYVQALGESMTANDEAKRYAFSHAGTNYLLLLGTSKTKVGPEWRSMQDQPMLVGGRVFVPEQYLPD